MITLDVRKRAYGNYGIGEEPGGKKVLVEFGLPGDRVDVEIINARKDYSTAEIRSFIKRSPLRKEKDFCPHFGRCGGCNFGDISYNDETDLKNGLIKEILEERSLKVDEYFFVPSKEHTGYRIRARFKIGPGKKLAYSEYKTNRLIEVDSCPVCAPGINEKIPVLNGLLKGLRGLSLVSEIELIAGDNGTGINLIVREPGRRAEETAGEIARRAGMICHSVSFPGEDEAVSFGRKVNIECGGSIYRIYPSTFFQANRGTAALMLDSVKNYCALKEIGGTLVDLYSGAGFFSYAVKDKFKDLFMVERSASAVSDGKGMFSGRPATAFYNKSISTGLKYLKFRHISPSLIIADPPRTNPPAFIFENMASMKSPFLIYVSCNPPAFFDNLKYFIKSNYFIDNLICFDMFPRTYHIECAVFLRKKPPVRNRRHRE